MNRPHYTEWIPEDEPLTETGKRFARARADLECASHWHGKKTMAEWLEWRMKLEAAARAFVEAECDLRREQT
jgi:hypothetical protein